MTKAMAYGAALLACLLLWGCGGDGGVSQSVHDQTLQDLEALQAEIRAQEEAEAEEAARLAAEEAARRAAQEAEKEAAEQQSQLDTLTETITALTTALAERRAEAEVPEVPETAEVEEVEEAEEEETPATPAVTPPVVPPVTPQPTTPTPEANQRAQNAKTALGSDNTRQTMLGNIGLSITALTPSSLRTRRGGHRDGSISPIANRSGTWIRSTTMPLISGGDSGKTVVYTDRELRRPLLEHFGQFRDSGVPRQIDADNTGGATLVTLSTDITNITGGRATPSTGVSFSHGLRGSLGANDRTFEGAINNTTWDHDGDAATPEEPRGTNTSRALTVMDDAFPMTVHGVSGQGLCKGVGCMLTVTGTYNDNNPDATTATENDLARLQIVSPSGLYFRPSSPTASLSLCDDATRCTAGTDGEYMTFGYWREDPTSAAAPYIVGVFAEAAVVTNSLGLPNDPITATYDGIAVGMYVEQDPNDPVDTHRQGEFTADVGLRLNNVAPTPAGLTGTIDDFVTTPTGGSAPPRTADRWVVRLSGSAFDVENGIQANTTAYIDNLAGVKTGSWDAAFVWAHANAATDTGTPDPSPPAVTGTFKTEIADFVSLLGAYGAQKR